MFRFFSNGFISFDTTFQFLFVFFKFGVIKNDMLYLLGNCTSHNPNLQIFERQALKFPLSLFPSSPGTDVIYQPLCPVFSVCILLPSILQLLHKLLPKQFFFFYSFVPQRSLFNHQFNGQISEYFKSGECRYHYFLQFIFLYFDVFSSFIACSHVGEINHQVKKFNLLLF